MIEGRKYVIQAVFLITGIAFLVKLFTIQVTDKTYAKAATDNIILPVVEYPYRGLIFDRNGELIVYNNPQFDLTVIPQEVKQLDTLSICEILGLTREDFKQRLSAARKYSYVKPSPFFKMISNQEFGKIQDKLVDYPGFGIQARTSRAYSHPVLSNSLGYIAEISSAGLRQDSSRYYRQGDYIGKSGLELYYESQLRGKRGISYKIKNVRGIEKGSFEDGEFDTIPIPGQNLVSTIHLRLQLYAEKLLKGKVGSVVAIEPATGEILAIVSGPSYDPGMMVGRKYSSNFSLISRDSLNPLFNRPVMAMYPPGSIFKIVQSLIGLQENVLNVNETIYIDGRNIGDHAPPGYYTLHEAIRKSSNNYFFMAFRRMINQNLNANTFIDSRLGLDNWKSHVMSFGFGAPLGIDIPNEKGGFIPGSDYYDKIYGHNSWKFSTISSLSIGQGEMLLSPLQMANLAAIMANRGYYYTPHLVKEIGDYGPLSKFTEKHMAGIDEKHFPPVINAMQDVVTSTAWRAVIRDIEICGKTGTAENPHGEDHSVFMAFAPKKNPQIAISVYVENSGWGGRAAASIASLLIETYIRGNITRQWLEDYVLKGDFADATQ